MRILTETTPELSSGVPAGAIPEIGRLGMGVKAKTEKGIEYPKKTDHFVPRGEAAEGFTQIFGETPTRLPICFFSDDDNYSCSVRLEVRDQAGDLFAFSDGENYYFRHRKEAPDFQPGFTKVVSRFKHPDIEQRTLDKLRTGLVEKKASAIKWKQEMYLKFLIRGFPRIGYWQMTSGGENSSIPQVTQMVDTWKTMLGSLSMVPFDLVLKSAKSGDKVFNYINLLPAFSIEDALAISQSRKVLAGAEPVAASLLQAPLLTAPDEVQTDTLGAVDCGAVQDEVLTLVVS